MNDPGTWSTVWGLPVGVGEGWDGWRRAKGENQDNCNRISTKMIKMKQTIPPKQKKQNKTSQCRSLSFKHSLAYPGGLSCHKIQVL